MPDRLVRSVFCLFLMLGSASAVADSPCPASSPWQVNGDGTVTDSNAGLMWKRCAEGQSGPQCEGPGLTMTWEEAKASVAALNKAGGWAGYTDWQLPDAGHLRKLWPLDDCFAAVFPTTKPGNYWSNGLYNGGVFAQRFGENPLTASYKPTSRVYLRLVRKLQ